MIYITLCRFSVLIWVTKHTSRRGSDFILPVNVPEAKSQWTTGAPLRCFFPARAAPRVWFQYLSACALFLQYLWRTNIDTLYGHHCFSCKSSPAHVICEERNILLEGVLQIFVRQRPHVPVLLGWAHHLHVSLQHGFASVPLPLLHLIQILHLSLQS